jgi:hypothetical protein
VLRAPSSGFQLQSALSGAEAVKVQPALKGIFYEIRVRKTFCSSKVSGCLRGSDQVCGSEVKEDFLGQAGDRVGITGVMQLD